MTFPWGISIRASSSSVALHSDAQPVQICSDGLLRQQKEASSDTTSTATARNGSCQILEDAAIGVTCNHLTNWARQQCYQLVCSFIIRRQSVASTRPVCRGFTASLRVSRGRVIRLLYASPAWWEFASAAHRQRAQASTSTPPCTILIVPVTADCRRIFYWIPNMWFWMTSATRSRDTAHAHCH